MRYILHIPRRTFCPPPRGVIFSGHCDSPTNFVSPFALPLRLMLTISTQACADAHFLVALAFELGVRHLGSRPHDQWSLPAL